MTTLLLLVALTQSTDSEIAARLFASVQGPAVVDFEDVQLLQVESEQKLVQENRDSFYRWITGEKRMAKQSKRGVAFVRFDAEPYMGALGESQWLQDWVANLSPTQLDQVRHSDLLGSQLDDRGRALLHRTGATTDELRSPWLRGADPLVRLSAELKITVGPIGGRYHSFNLASPQPDPSAVEDVVKSADVPGLPYWSSTVDVSEPQYDANEAVSDFSEGRILTLRELALKIYADHKMVLRYDRRLAEAKLFIKGKWEVSELAEGVGMITDTSPATLWDESSRRQEAMEKLTALFEKVFGEDLGEYADLAYDAATGQSTSISLEDLFAKFPELRSSDTFRGLDGSLTATVRAGMLVNYDFGGTRENQMPDGTRIIMGNSARMGVKPPIRK